MSETSCLENVIAQLKQLPGVGEKTATRYAHFIIRQPKHYAEGLGDAIVEVREKLRTCLVCCNFTQLETCSICSNHERSDDIVCVVERPSDVEAIEKSHTFKGKYHVLHGSLSPLEGINESKLKIRELQQRLKERQTQEIILATNPTVEGDTTALYIARLIKYNGLKVTRIAHGIPVGSEIEYQDGATLGKALQNRVAL